MHFNWSDYKLSIIENINSTYTVSRSTILYVVSIIGPAIKHTTARACSVNRAVLLVLAMSRRPTLRPLKRLDVIPRYHKDSIVQPKLSVESASDSDSSEEVTLGYLSDKSCMRPRLLGIERLESGCAAYGESGCAGYGESGCAGYGESGCAAGGDWLSVSNNEYTCEETNYCSVTPQRISRIVLLTPQLRRSSQVLSCIIN